MSNSPNPITRITSLKVDFAAIQGQLSNMENAPDTKDFKAMVEMLESLSKHAHDTAVWLTTWYWTNKKGRL